MKEKSFTAKYKEFMHKLAKNYKSIEEFNYALMQEFPSIAPEYSIGKFVLHFTAPESMYSKHGIDAVLDIFTSDNYSENGIFEKTFTTGENGTATFIFYPDMYTVWGDDDKEELQFFAEQLFIYCGKARLMGLIRVASTHDSLTGALIYKELFRRGGIMVARGTLSKYSAIFMNIKNFKFINKTVGNNYGDDLMAEFAERILMFLDENESLTRLGGDNFVVLVLTQRLDNFISLFDDMMIEVNAGDKHETFKIEVRMGIYNIKPHDTMPNIMNCVAAAFAVARMGIYGDHVFFKESMIEHEIESQKTIIKFSKAIKNNEFVVFYQPKIFTDDLSLCGCEALVRWRIGNEIIPPGKFIPILERDDSICKLDFYVLDMVCRDIKEWKKQGITPVRVSVNFSKNHLVTPIFAKTILEIINKYSIDPRFIEIELTESSSFENIERMISFISTMRRAGISVSIDDFGTGYSSLSAIKRLDADTIKIDKSFIDGIGKKDDQIILKNIVSMLNDLDKQVLAEGVERDVQAAYLKNIGCDVIQGYLYDKPLPKEEYTKRLIDRDWYKAK
ncbi:MAG: GGDEF domain-containing phosphodiesterase [Lachnospiraceae bacterium]|nr:GGDEF domain-containing phosphodiesterase [Lachnospiraceae bacterium]